ncbi:PIG-L family deacetylase [Streptomyces sp. NPDC047081]|uniref:PIG-L deacetylase family protein n=1 Tax=Streptomyces sp. NPDC047081 TaxID=3154706 RepID=UPI0033C318B6
MPPINLPEPDADGIYTFPEALLDAHRSHQQVLDAQLCGGDTSVIDVTAPYTGQRFVIQRPAQAPRPLVVIEPHHDDLALSASGMLLSQSRPMTVITVFTRSNTVHRTARQRYPDESAVSTLRAIEAREALRVFSARRVLLGHPDARPPYRPYDPALLDKVVQDLENALSHLPDAELLAPAAVTRHPDHLLVHEAARRLGCRWFWEDVAFWSTYGLSVDDRQLFRERVGDSLTEERYDITPVLLDKFTLLRLHASQLQPDAALYRPLRYAWTVAAPLRQRSGQARFAERFFRSGASRR